MGLPATFRRRGHVLRVRTAFARMGILVASTLVTSLGEALIANLEALPGAAVYNRAHGPGAEVG